MAAKNKVPLFLLQNIAATAESETFRRLFAFSSPVPRRGNLSGFMTKKCFVVKCEVTKTVQSAAFPETLGCLAAREFGIGSSCVALDGDIQSRRHRCGSVAWVNCEAQRQWCRVGDSPVKLYHGRPAKMALLRHRHP